MPRIDDSVNQLQKAKYFTAIDLAWGFWGLPLDEESKDKSAFITQDGHYRWRRMPMGWHGSPAIFQKAMDALLVGIQGLYAMCYIDDLLVFPAPRRQGARRPARRVLSLLPLSVTIHSGPLRGSLGAVFLYSHVSFRSQLVSSGSAAPGGSSFFLLLPPRCRRRARRAACHGRARGQGLRRRWWHGITRKIALWWLEGAGGGVICAAGSRECRRARAEGDSQPAPAACSAAAPPAPT